jgi:hypothetical protein
MAYKPKANERAIEIDGLPQLFAALKKLGTPVEAITEANRAAGMPVVQTARNIVPVKSGALRNSIRMNRATTNVKVMAGYKRVPYANPIHWGWFVDKKTGVRRNIKPNPFLAKALGYNRDEILKNYTNQIQKLIKGLEPTPTQKKGK